MIMVENKIPYVPEDFAEGMIIQALVDDKDYSITKNEIYEITKITLVVRDGSETNEFVIEYMGDFDRPVSKSVNLKFHPFDAYFKIVR